MKCVQVHDLLDSIKQGNTNTGDSETLSFLVEQGFVSSINSTKYINMQSDISNLDAVQRNFQRINEQVEEYEQKKNRINRKLNSWLHRTFSFQSTLDREKMYLGRVESSYKTFAEKRDKLKEEQDRLRSLKSDLENYIKFNGQYVKTTERGLEALKQLSIRLSRLENVSYENFKKDVEQREKEIDARYKRFNELNEYLIGQGFEKGDSKVINYAIVLSGLEGSFEDIYKRSGVINSYLYEQKWKNYNRLAIIAAVAAQEGDIDELQKQLKDTFVVMTEDGHSKSYSAWLEAAFVMQIPGQDAKTKINRYSEMRDALSKRGWSKGSHSTCYIAANLAQREGAAEDIAEEFRNLEKKLVERGRNDCVESGMASLILLDGKGTLDEKADRFTESFETMHKYGWAKDTKNYVAAAFVSLMPGTIEENVKLMDDLTEKMKKDGFKYVTNRAVPIVGGFNGLLKYGVGPFLMPSSSSSSSRSSSSSSSSDDDDDWLLYGAGLGIGLGLFD